MNYAWPAAFAFAAMCAAVAYATVNAPPTRDAKVVCIEQRGKWIGWPATGTCEFPANAVMK